MMNRIRHFAANAGRSSVWRTALVGVALPIIAVGMMRDGHGVWPLACVIAGALMPWLLRKQLVDRLERASAALRVGGIAIVAIAIVGGYLRERLDLSPRETTLALSALFFSCAAYLSGYFWMLSDPQVIREPD